MPAKTARKTTMQVAKWHQPIVAPQTDEEKLDMHRFFEPHTDEEYQAIKDKIAADGIVKAGFIVTDEYGSFIDGRAVYRAALELKIEAPIEILRLYATRNPAIHSRPLGPNAVYLPDPAWQAD